MRIREIEPQQVKFADALEFSSVFCVAFRNDVAAWIGQRPLYRFNGSIQDRVLAVKDPENRLSMLVAMSQAFKHSVFQRAWSFYKEMIQPGRRTFIAYDDTVHDHPVAISLWATPPVAIQSESWSMRIWRFLKTLRANIHMWAFRLSHGFNPAMDAKSKSIFGQARSILGLKNTTERESALENSSESKLLKMPYTDKYAYELLVFGCASPGRGIGSWFFDKTLANIESGFQDVLIGNAKRRPKAAIIASNEGRRLYSKFGFEPLGVYEKLMGHDDGEEKFSISLMMKSY